MSEIQHNGIGECFGNAPWQKPQETAGWETGPTVYVGDTHYTTCDTDGWHRDHLRSTGQVIGKSCRCSDWVGGCAAGTKRRKSA